MVSRAKSRHWTRDETLIVFNLYYRISLNASNKSHPDVQHIAQLIGRTPDSVKMKIWNFGSFDPELKNRGIRGLRNATRLDQEVWDEFHQDWQACIDESERLIAERERALAIPPRYAEDALEDEDTVPREGRERMATVAVRENQSFFRKTILAAYENRCCVTGIDVETLLNASHIKPWAESNQTEKLNPQNGLCLNVLHDRAFDRGLITLADDYAVIVSNQVRRTGSDAVRKMLLDYADRKIQLPTRFKPRDDFLAWHRENVFVG